MRDQIRRATAALVLAAVTTLASTSGASAQGTAPPPPPPPPPIPGVTQVPIRVLHGSTGAVLVLVAVTVQSHPLLFILDTGASGSLIDRRVARALGLPRSGHRHRFRGVAGGGSAQPVRISDWKLGALSLPTRRIDSTPLTLARGVPLVGLLGSDVLSTFGKVSIDFAHQIMTLGG